MYIPRNRLFWAVGLGHFTNDLFISMGPVTLAFLSASILPMSNTQIGLAISAGQMLGAVSQPFFGLSADRRGGRWIAAGGLIWQVGLFVLALLLALTTRQYWVMVLPFVILHLGSGALHPVGTLHAADAEPNRVASNMAYFFLLGQLGLAMGPALAGFLLDVANTNPTALFTGMIGMTSAFSMGATLSPLLIFSLASLPAIVLMVTTIPVYHPAPSSDDQPHTEKSAGASLPANLPIMGLSMLGLMVILRGLAQPGSVNFIPLLFQAKGWSPSEYGLITSSFWVAAGFSGVAFGNLADRYDRRWVVMISLLLSAPAFFLLPLTDGLVAFGLAIAAGGLSGGSHSIIVVLAQELIPGKKGFASGATLGFIFGSGALGSVIIGTMSDSLGLGPTFQIVAATTVIAGFLSLLLPRSQQA